MTDEVKACIGTLCSALEVKSITAKDLPMVEAWTQLPRFSLPRFRFIVEEARRVRGKINSARYFDELVREAFSEPETPVAPRPRLLAERPWAEYLTYLSEYYGEPDAYLQGLWRDRWETERRRLGIPTEDGGNVSRETIDPVPGTTV